MQAPSINFDAIAPHYRWMEFILAGEKLQRCRMAFLDQVAMASNVLIVGEGHGRFLAECRRRLPGARITCVDSSERMLNIARARLKRAGFGMERTTLEHADLLDWSARVGSADLIVTQFFLDCFRSDQLQRVIAQLSRAACEDASWLVADFQAPLTGPARWRARLILKLMY